MLQAAVRGLGEGATEAGLPVPMALAVTVLTSEPIASAELLNERLAAAIGAGCGGVVCAATDLPVIRSAAPDIVTVVPGIRPAGVPTHDQRRVATPAEAIRNGADILVIGRAVTAADNPAAGRRSEALAASERAVAMLKELAEADRATHLPALARSCWTAVYVRRTLGTDRVAALAFCDEAIRLYRELVDKEPEAFRDDLTAVEALRQE